MAITPGCIARKRTKKRHKEIRGLSEEEGRRGVADQKEQLQAQSREVKTTHAQERDISRRKKIAFIYKKRKSGRETFGQIGG